MENDSHTARGVKKPPPAQTRFLSLPFIKSDFQINLSTPKDLSLFIKMHFRSGATSDIILRPSSWRPNRFSDLLAAFPAPSPPAGGEGDSGADWPRSDAMPAQDSMKPMSDEHMFSH